MTELGANGIVAVSREVRSVSLIQAIVGIFYLAVLISRIMSSYRSPAILVEVEPASVAQADPESRP